MSAQRSTGEQSEARLEECLEEHKRGVLRGGTWRALRGMFVGGGALEGHSKECLKKGSITQRRVLMT